MLEQTITDPSPSKRGITTKTNNNVETNKPHHTHAQKHKNPILQADRIPRQQQPAIPKPSFSCTISLGCSPCRDAPANGRPGCWSASVSCIAFASHARLFSPSLLFLEFLFYPFFCFLSFLPLSICHAEPGYQGCDMKYRVISWGRGIVMWSRLSYIHAGVSSREGTWPDRTLGCMSPKRPTVSVLLH